MILRFTTNRNFLVQVSISLTGFPSHKVASQSCTKKIKMFTALALLQKRNNKGYYSFVSEITISLCGRRNYSFVKRDRQKLLMRSLNMPILKTTEIIHFDMTFLIPSVVKTIHLETCYS